MLGYSVKDTRECSPEYYKWPFFSKNLSLERNENISIIHAALIDDAHHSIIIYNLVIPTDRELDEINRQGKN